MKYIILTIVLILIFNVSSQDFNWANTFTKEHNSTAYSGDIIYSDTIGNIYSCHDYFDSLKLLKNSGNSIVSVGSNYRSVVLVKTSLSGNIIDSLKLYTIGNCSINNFKVSKSGNYVLFYGRGVDPVYSENDPITPIVGPGNYSNGISYLILFDNNFNALFSVRVLEQNLQVSVDDLGNVFIAKPFSSNMYVKKLSSNGTLIWQKDFESTVYQVNNMAVDYSNQLILNLEFTDTTTFIQTDTTFVFGQNNYSKKAICKFDENGDISKVIKYSSLNNATSIKKIETTKGNNLLVYFKFYGDSITIQDSLLNPINPASFSYYFSIIDSNLNLKNHLFVNDINNGLANFSAIRTDRIIFTNGNTLTFFDENLQINHQFTTNYTPTAVNAYNTGYNIGLQCYTYNTIDVDPSFSIALASVLYDLNFALCNYDYNDCFSNKIIIDSISPKQCNQLRYIYLNPTSYFNENAITTSNGVNNTYNIPFTNEGIIQINASNSFCHDSIKLVLDSVQNQIDLGINLVPSRKTNLSTHLHSYFTLDAYNLGCESTSGEIKLVSSAVNTIESITGNYNINGDTIVWLFNNLSSENGDAYETIVFGSNTGDLDFEVSISTVQYEANLSNNIKKYHFENPIPISPTSEAYVKSHPDGLCTSNYLTIGQKLTYIVKYQSNQLGLDRILDIHLSSLLNGNSFAPLSSENSFYIEQINPQHFRVHFTTNNYSDDNWSYFIFECDPVASIINNDLVTCTVDISGLQGQFISNLNDTRIFSDGSQFTSPDTLDIISCDNYFWPGQGTIYNSGFYTQALQNQYGCDSVIYLNLALSYSTSSTLSESSCDSIVINNVSYYSTGTYTQVVSNSEFCDSTITINAVINNETIHLTESVCDEFIYHGVTYDTTSIYIIEEPNQFGCFTTSIIDLTVLSNDTTIEVNALNGYYLNNVFYSQSGIYEQTFTNNYGCDSIVKLILNVDYLGVNTLKESETISAFPNPFESTFFIQSTKQITVEQITDTRGKIVSFNQESSVGQTKVTTTNLSPGVYFVTFIFNNNLQTIPLIKK